MIPTNWATEPWTTSMELRHGAPSSRRALMDHWQFCCVNYVCTSYQCWDWLLFDSHMSSPSLPWFVYLARFMMILCFRLTSDRAYKVSVSRLQFRYQNLCDFSSVYIESSPHILKWTTIFDGNAMDDFNLFWPASQFASRLSFDKERNGKSLRHLEEKQTSLVLLKN